MKLESLRRCWDRASIYLPVLIMGGLALGSYWILQGASAPPEPAAARAPSGGPDYFMQGFAIRSHRADGTLAREIFGAQARHFPDSDRLEIEGVRLRAFSEQGQLTSASARRLSTDSAQSDYLLEGEVRVERAAGRNARGEPLPALGFEGEQLRLLSADQRIESDLPVLLTRGPDRISADRMRYDDDSGIADLQGRVRARLTSR